MIKYSCKCGTALSAPDIQAGAKIKCYSCQELITIPQKSTAGDPAAANLGVVTCSDCKKDYSIMKSVNGGCSHCGWNNDRIVRMCLRCETPLVLPGANAETDFEKYRVFAAIMAVFGFMAIFGGKLRYLFFLFGGIAAIATLGGMGIRALGRMTRTYCCVNCQAKPPFIGKGEKKRVADFQASARIAAIVAFSLAAVILLMVGSMFLAVET